MSFDIDHNRSVGDGLWPPGRNMTVKKIINLRQMTRGQTGVIARVRGMGEINRRIRDMGLLPGTTVTIKGRAPLYDPVAIKVRGYDVTLRNNEADHIDVEIEAPELPAD